MLTRGKVAKTTSRSLYDHTAFGCKGSDIWAVEGTVSELGRLDSMWASLYAVQHDEIVYTVLSYDTPIAWVLRTGAVIIPDAKYSVTTSHHQSLCKVYL
jgi:hypothetical protein